MYAPKARQHESWSIADLIDFEILVAEDAAALQDDQLEGLKRRDRAIYLAVKTPKAKPDGNERRWWFHKWLQARTQTRFSNDCTPGEEVCTYFGWATFGLGFAGSIISASVVAGLFHGTSLRIKGNPLSVDITWYFLIFAVLPFTLSLMGMCLLGRRQGSRSIRRRISPLRSVALRLLDRSIRALAQRVSEKLPEERKLSANALIGVFEQRWKVRKDVVWAQVIRLVQVFGLSFTVCVVISTLFMTITGHAYSWSTDWGFDAKSVHKLAQAIAAPWSWAVPSGLGVPSLEQVHSSEAGRQAITGSATAWRNFLVLSAFVYGVVPRAILYLWSTWLVRSALKRQDFDEPRFDCLWERLMTPHVSVEKDPEPNFEIARLPISLSTGQTSSDPYTIIFPAELNDPRLAEAVADFMRQKGLKVGESIVLPELPKAISTEITKLPESPVYLVHESWMWQAGELTDLLREIRNSVGTKRTVILALLGKPNGEPLGGEPLTQDVDVWERLINAEGDPYLAVRTFLPPQ